MTLHQSLTLHEVRILLNDLILQDTNLKGKVNPFDLSDEVINILYDLMLTADPQARDQKWQLLKKKTEQTQENIKKDIDNSYKQIYQIKEQIDAIIQIKANLKELSETSTDTNSLTDLEAELSK